MGCFIKIAGGQDLMNSRAHASEDVLGVIARKSLRGEPAAQKALDDDAEVVLAEIIPAVVEWNRGVRGPLWGGALAIWSAGPDLAFARWLRAAGFVVEEVAVRAHTGNHVGRGNRGQAI